MNANDVITQKYQTLDSEKWSIEIATESVQLVNGLNLRDIPCAKNQGHQRFIPFSEFKLTDLPEEYRNRELFENIKSLGSCVVRLVVSSDEGQTTGTGWAIDKSDGSFLIITNYHVVKSDEDAANCVAEFHYDSSERSNIFVSQITDINWTCPYRDKSSLKFEPVPDSFRRGSLDRKMYLPDVHILYKNDEFSHHQSLLDFKDNMVKALLNINPNDSNISNITVKFCDNFESRLASNIIQINPQAQRIDQKLVTISNKDGWIFNGEIIELNGQKVVKLLSFLTQIEVEELRITFEDGSVCSDCSLYFDETYDSINEVISVKGVDRQQMLEKFPNRIWLVALKPLPPSIDTTGYSDLMIAIGHPHGGPKMISFGKVLGTSIENLLGNEVECLQYSCPTCPGSSGSLILRVAETKNFCYIINPHFMGVKADMWNNEHVQTGNVNLTWAYRFIA